MNDRINCGRAVFSPCNTYRYRLERDVQEKGIIIVYFGVNGSTATEYQDDQTTKKWFGFTLRNGGRKYIAVNPFAFRATDVRKLSLAADPVGPENDHHLREAITDGDILVPCWGSRKKVPKSLRYHFDDLLTLLQASGKPIKTLGFTKEGDPCHPLMLRYDTPLEDWHI